MSSIRTCRSWFEAITDSDGSGEDLRATVEAVGERLLRGGSVDREQEADHVALLLLLVAGREKHRVGGQQVRLPLRIVEQFLERARLAVMQVRCAQAQSVERRHVETAGALGARTV